MPQCYDAPKWLLLLKGMPSKYILRNIRKENIPGKRLLLLLCVPAIEHCVIQNKYQCILRWWGSRFLAFIFIGSTFHKRPLYKGKFSSPTCRQSERHLKKQWPENTVLAGEEILWYIKNVAKDWFFFIHSKSVTLYSNPKQLVVTKLNRQTDTKVKEAVANSKLHTSFLLSWMHCGGTEQMRPEWN